MEFIVIPLIGFLTSGLTFFSGFGLGTLLLPAFIAFFPAEVAIGMTAIVHALNNLFKFSLIRRNIDGGVVVRFGIPAVIAAYLGAQLLGLLSDTQAEIRYALLSQEFVTTRINLVMGALIAFFAVAEIVPWLTRLTLDRRYLPVGGVLSGFFGGLSGHQGAFRSAFLLHSGLSKEAFIASGIAIALMVDTVRLSVYGVHLSGTTLESNLWLIATVVAGAFAGSFLARRFMEKTTLQSVQILVSVLLFLVAGGLVTGWLG